MFSVSLFLVDSEHKQLVATVFERADHLSEIRMPMDRGIVGQVVALKQSLNVRDVNRLVAECGLVLRSRGGVL